YRSVVHRAKRFVELDVLNGRMPVREIGDSRVDEERRAVYAEKPRRVAGSVPVYAIHRRFLNPGSPAEICPSWKTSSREQRVKRVSVRINNSDFHPELHDGTIR